MLDFDFFCDSYCSTYIKYLSLITVIFTFKICQLYQNVFHNSSPCYHTNQIKVQSGIMHCILDLFSLNHPFLFFLF